MNLYEDKNNYRELIVSYRDPHYNGNELRELIKDFVSTKRDKCRMVACWEQGTDLKKWHSHIFIHWPVLFRIPLTTFRSQIQKHFGVSNTVYDWKLRKIKYDVLQSFKYVSKGGTLLVSNDDSAVELFHQYRGTYVPHTRGPVKASSVVANVLQYLKRCDTCKEWNRPFCKDDVKDCIIDYYIDKDKVMDLYFMKKLCETVYYREVGHRDDLKEKLDF